MHRAKWPVVFAISVALGSEAAHAISVTGTRSAVTPVQKVVELLKKLSDSVQQEGTEEAASYDKFACFCREQSDHKVYALKKAGVKIDNYQSAVESLGAEITKLDGEVVTLKGEVGTEESGANETAIARQAAFEKYDVVRQNLTEGVNAITNALEALRNSRDSVSQAKVLAQTEALLNRRSLGSAELLGKQMPADYKYSSNDVIATLQELLKTFKSQLDDADTDEATERNAYEMSEGARANKIKALKADILEKETLSAKKGEEKSEKQGLLDAEVKAKSQDQAFFDELTTTCESKAKAWDQRSKARASELTALTEAAEQLEGMGDLYEVNSKLVGFVSKGQKIAQVRPHYVGKAAAFVQLRQVVQGNVGRPTSVAAFLESRARTLSSGSLAQAAAALQDLASLPEETGSTDHFVKVRSIIKDLVAQLEAEAQEEATTKSFCDTQMAAAVAKRDEQKAAMETAAASIEAKKADISELASTITQLGEEIADLYKALKEMTDIRQEEQKVNNNTIIDADAGAQAVKQAIVVLKNYYGSQPTTLLQKSATSYEPTGGDRDGNTVSDLAPETFSGEYAGKLSSSKGVIGLLEVIQSDFERTSSTTAALESEQEGAYQTQKTSTEGDIATKEGAKGTAETDKGTAENDLIGLEDSARDAAKLHAAALEELDKLKPMCVDSSESYAVRRKKRQEEIESLREALNILQEWQA